MQSKSSKLKVWPTIQNDVIDGFHQRFPFSTRCTKQRDDDFRVLNWIYQRKTGLVSDIYMNALNKCAVECKNFCINKFASYIISPHMMSFRLFWNWFGERCHFRCVFLLDCMFINKSKVWISRPIHVMFQRNDLCVFSASFALLCINFIKRNSRILRWRWVIVILKFVWNE